MPKGIVNTYRLLWIFLILAFGAVIWWFALRSPDAMKLAEEFDTSQIKRPQSEQEQQQEQSEKVKETFENSAPKEIEVDDADFQITGASGETEMKLWVKSGTRDGTTFSLIEGTMVFRMEDRSTVLLRITDGNFSSENGQVRVEGSITGNFEGTNHFFEARKLVWQQDSNSLQTETVRYVGSFVDVTAQSMVYDVATGEVRFDGPVSAGI